MLIHGAELHGGSVGRYGGLCGGVSVRVSVCTSIFLFSSKKLLSALGLFGFEFWVQEAWDGNLFYQGGVS